jgi:hypothetical protein
MERAASILLGNKKRALLKYNLLFSAESSPFNFLTQPAVHLAEGNCIKTRSAHTLAGC